MTFFPTDSGQERGNVIFFGDLDKAQLEHSFKK
jgi:hypothetical protein